MTVRLAWKWVRVAPCEVDGLIGDALDHESTIRISPVHGAISDIDVEILATGPRLDGILTREALKSRVVVARPVVVQARAILLAPRVLKGVRVWSSAGRRGPEGFVGVLAREGPGVIGQGDGGTQGVGQQGAAPGGIAAGEVLVDPETSEEGRRVRPDLLHRGEAVIEELGARAVDE